MPRAHLYHLPGYVWHLTARCHRQQWLLRFARDRRAWVHWLYVARRRFALCVLNYQVTSNHVHLLVHDRGGDEIARSLQLIEGCTGQAYNRRKRRRGAFWEDSYHATAVDTEAHLARCMTYIDLNMVRAGAVAHPCQWGESGYAEIQRAPQRYRIIDRAVLCGLLGVAEARLAMLQNQWIEAALAGGRLQREPHWSEALAVGSRPFAECVQAALGGRARYRHLDDAPGVSVLRESEAPYEAHSRAEMVRLNAPDGCDFNQSSAQRGGCGGETALGSLGRDSPLRAARQPPPHRTTGALSPVAGPGPRTGPDSRLR